MQGMCKLGKRCDKWQHRLGRVETSEKSWRAAKKEAN